MPTRDDKPREIVPTDAPAAMGSPPLSPPGCPHCSGELKAHEATSGPKAGAMHCDSCGCCLVDGAVRTGHGSCPAAIA